jgi:ABC-2 type transport system permease protein
MARTIPPTSFSAGRRWGIFFSVMISIGAVAALVVMLNYLGARHFLRFSWSARTSQQLSLPTLSLLNSITNDVKVTIYYDKTDGLYDDIAGLLNEYHLANPKISVETVDYGVDTAAAFQIKSRYGLTEDKNLLIYECNGQVVITSGDRLANFTVEALPDDSQSDNSQPGAPGQPKMKFNRHAVQFDGEGKVDADLIRVTGPPLKACYLIGNGEPSPEPLGQGKFDYSGFVGVLSENHISTSALSLEGTNTIPADCNLLVIVSPRYALEADELDKISAYLDAGGRIFVLFNNYQVQPFRTGLESILAQWGVQVGMNTLKDPDNTAAEGLVEITNFKTNHPCVSSLVGSRLLLLSPRSISPGQVATPQGQEPPSVVPLAWVGPRAYYTSGGSQYPAAEAPVIVAVEKKNVKGVVQRGTTRIIVAGDSGFLATGNIDFPQAANHDFAEMAVRWLLDQTQSMGGVPPRKVTEYRVTLTHAQMNSIRWIFLGAMPGGILLFGGLVWLRRRH